MSRIQQTFEQLHGRTALVSYITCGDPDLATTLQLMQTLVANGTDIIELGVPFSDPMADGSVIQAAIERALRHHVSLADVLQVVAQFRQENQTTPVVLMGYLNPVYHMGYERFAQAAVQAGVDGVLTVDCPAEAIDDLYVQLQKNGLDCIFLIAPTTTDERIKLIGSRASGFVYYVSLKGVTGSSQLDTTEVSRKIDHLRQFIQVPVGVGFGIRDADSARRIGAIADAVIVGSRFVQTIAEHAGREAEALAPVVAELKQALE
ncbi:MAG: tryptophan synthase subunit alpha [Snodgrassella sp.]|uniref:Tryptophan synthase alpha chain n=1 Tax=Snodgrassella alvi TaxID=1196083 RepID=A0A2N9XTJ7_9NEIS|nr:MULTISPECIES: tryptophan synthase subunit alpha [Snodgrassella]MCO6505939.1 tryptophan synthase subunit alpha [Snodgrassella sp.]MCO6508243.1 tryptophan synthase subunit alpha [Snodgrassella sp.]MCO6513377.1 tryptophan synthase subunit alpha [Snodgrassella sp.]MCO6515287.1 tryptophan synthase subunit alpha [Snodgrassella sp.]MCO6521767.1 tryptophan synthase subunit alpha [Snodgrassella sp.]